MCRICGSKESHRNWFQGRNACDRLQKPYQQLQIVCYKFEKGVNNKFNIAYCRHFMFLIHCFEKKRNPDVSTCFLFEDL